MAQGGGLRAISATLLVATSLLLAGCDSSKPSESPQIPARSAAPTQAAPTLAAASANPTSSPAPPTAAATTGPGPTAAATAPPSVAPSDAASPTPSALTAAIAAIEAADLADEDSLDALGPLRFTTAGRDAAKVVLERGSGSPGQIWAAIVVYASSGNDPAPLRPFATDQDASVAVLAAATLVSFGDATGFATLERSLASEELLAGSHPPKQIGDFALATLERYVTGADVPFLTTNSTVDTYLADWTGWLDAHLAGLTFDAATGTWGAP
jgi:hypothetical protein